MVARMEINPATRAYILSNMNENIKVVMQKTGVSRRSIFRIRKEKLEDVLVRSPNNRICGGRPSKLSINDVRRILREVIKLRSTFPNWTAKRLMLETGMTNVSIRTVRRVLNTAGYYYLQALKKGLMSSSDRKHRVNFARNMISNYDDKLWTDKVAFYFDGVNFVYKRNPKDQALAPRARVWRQDGEGLLPGCIAKGKKEGTGAPSLRMFVAISHNEGVICAESYSKLNGLNFAKFVQDEFGRIFERSNKDSKMWVQDGDPSQNSKVAQHELNCIDAELLAIPPRSPDCNPIENVFKQVKDKLYEDAIKYNIEKESFAEFEERVKATLLSFPRDKIDKIIGSMGKRMKQLIIGKGNRLRY